MPLFYEVVVDSSHQTVSALPRPPDVAGTRPVDVALADQTLKAQRFARELRREGLADDAVASVAADDPPGGEGINLAVAIDRGYHTVVVDLNRFQLCRPLDTMSARGQSGFQHARDPLLKNR